MTLAATAVNSSSTTGPAPEPGFGFRVDLNRSDLALDYADGSGGDRLEVSRIGVGIFETITPYLRVGLSGGHLGVDQADRAAISGRDPYGYYGAFRALGQYPLTSSVRLALGAGLGYSEADDGHGDDEVRLTWWHARLRPAIRWRIGERVRLRVGASAQWLDGKEEIDRGRAARVDFSEDGVASAFFGLSVFTGHGGRIGLRGEAGPVRSLHLVFERRY